MIDGKKNKAIFLDRDGTINIEKNYLYKIEEFEFLPGVIEALKIFQNAGYILIIVTNQSGIARGYYDEEDLKRLNKWLMKSLDDKGIQIRSIYYCPHHPKAIIEKYRENCNCRKPKIGMYMSAVADFNISLDESYVIGDKFRDCAICEKTKCRGFLVENNEKQEVIEKVKSGDYPRIEYAQNLYEAALKITMLESEKNK